MKRSLLLGAVAGMLLLAISSVRAEDIPYAPWQGQVQTGTMPELIKNLRTLIDKAERDKAANPLFLKDLRTLADQYGGPVAGWPVRLLYDDFQDGQYTSNPAWTVMAGQWQVGNVGRTPALFSQVGLDSSGQSSNNKGGGLSYQCAGRGAEPAKRSEQHRNHQGQDPAGHDPDAGRHHRPVSDQADDDLGGRAEADSSISAPTPASAGNSYQITYEPAAARGLVLSRLTEAASRPWRAPADPSIWRTANPM